MATANTRIYIVRRPLLPNAKPRLVKAANAAQARRHAAASYFTVDVASQDDLVAAVKDGVEVEDSSATVEEGAQ